MPKTYLKFNFNNQIICINRITPGHLNLFYSLKLGQLKMFTVKTAFIGLISIILNLFSIFSNILQQFVLKKFIIFQSNHKTKNPVKITMLILALSFLTRYRYRMYTLFDVKENVAQLSRLLSVTDRYETETK